MRKPEHVDGTIHEQIALQNSPVSRKGRTVLDARRFRRTITDRISSNSISSKRVENPKWTIDSIRDTIQQKKKIPWGEVPSAVLREILTRAAEEISEAKGINLPATLLTSQELRQTRFRVTNSILNTLYLYYATQTDGSVMGAIFEAAGLEHQVTDIKIAKELGRDTQWDEWSNTALHKLFTAVAEDEKIKKPASLLDYYDMEQELEFLGRNLITLFNYAFKTSSPGKTDPLKNLLETVGHFVTKDDCRFAFTDDRSINWNRIRGKSLGEFLDDAASEIGTPLIFWSRPIFYKEFNIIGGKNFHKLYKFLIENVSMYQDGKTAIQFLLEFSGTELTPQQLYQHRETHPDLWNNLPPQRKTELLQYAGVIQTFPELINALKENHVSWEGVVPELRQQLIRQLVLERGVPPTKLSHYNFRQPASFLNGQNLNSLFEFIAQGLDPQASQSEIVRKLLDYAGISIPTPQQETPSRQSQTDSDAPSPSYPQTLPDIIQAIRAANLTSESHQIYLFIVQMRNQGMNTNQIAQVLSRELKEIKKCTEELRVAKILPPK